MAPTTQKQWSISGTDKGFDGLQFIDAEVPKCGENEVLVQMRGASLNYRDLIIPKVRRPLGRHQLTPTPTDMASIGHVPLPHQLPRGGRLRRRR